MKALSVGFGVFMGIIPIWGFQLATAVALAFLFRLNKLLVVIAANISLPPMIPLIIFLSYVIGNFWMGEEAVKIPFSKEITLEWMRKSIGQYILGAFTLAILAGVIFGAITLVLIRLFKKPSGS